jgi:hypothetical protein
MKQKTLIFGTPKNVTNPGVASTVYRFPFTMVDSDLIGKPEQQRSTSEHRLIVEISRWNERWAMSESDYVKVLFEIGRRDVEKKLCDKGSLGKEEKVTITTKTHPGDCPFDPVLIKEPEGYTCTVDIKSSIGF